MTPEDKEFVREVFPWIQAEDDRFEKATYLKWSNRLLTLLIESEGMRMKAEYERDHRRELCTDERHYRSDSQWIAAARKELVGDG